MSKRNRDLKKSRKSSYVGVFEMDQNRARNRKISRLCHVFVSAITWPLVIQIE